MGRAVLLVHAILTVTTDIYQLRRLFAHDLVRSEDLSDLIPHELHALVVVVEVPHLAAQLEAVVACELNYFKSVYRLESGSVHVLVRAWQFKSDWKFLLVIPANELRVILNLAEVYLLERPETDLLRRLNLGLLDLQLNRNFVRVTIACQAG